MAGVKGRSGGARPGAGRKPRPPQVTVSPPAKLTAPLDESPAESQSAVSGGGEPVASDAMEFLRQVMRGEVVPSVPQLEAAKLLARLQVTPAGGKKEALGKAAEKVASKFGARPAPLKVVGGRG